MEVFSRSIEKERYLTPRIAQHATLPQGFQRVVKFDEGQQPRSPRSRNATAGLASNAATAPNRCGDTNCARKKVPVLRPTPRPDMPIQGDSNGTIHIGVPSCGARPGALRFVIASAIQQASISPGSWTCCTDRVEPKGEKKDRRGLRPAQRVGGERYLKGELS